MSSLAPLESIKPDNYPRLSREGLGALKFNWRKANVKDDWTKGGRLSDAWDRVSGWPYWKKPSYDLDYGLRVVAKIAQEIPAWREVVGQIAGLLTSRMPQYAAWFDWVEERELDPNSGRYSYFTYRSLIPPGFAGVYNSPGYIGNGIKTHLDEIEASLHVAPRRQPRAEHPYYPQHSPAVGRQYNPDPIYGNGSSNMMYKGYFAHQLMLAYVMTGDQKFLQPQHLVYDDDIQYWYSVKDIVEIMNQQHLGDVDENGSPLLYGIDCEVGKMFPVCVSVGGLANHLYDKVFGTNYRKGYDRWLDWARDNITGGHTEEDGPYAWCAPYFDRDIPYCMNEPHQQLGAFFIGPAMQFLPIDAKYATRIYEGMFKQYGREGDDGLHIVWPPELTPPVELEDKFGTSAGLAFAHEINDVERLDGLHQWFERHAGATYKDGEFYFTYGFEESWPRGIPNAWATLAYIGEPGSLRKMYNELNLEKFDQPSVVGIDYPGVNVSQAIYDAGKGALLVRIEPGTARQGSGTTFRVTNLGYHGGHQVQADGKPYEDWSEAGPGEIIIRTPVVQRTFVAR